MSRRIAQFEGTTYTVKVHRDTEYNEYRVTLVAADGTTESTYHTDDKEDALSTAQSILRHAEPARAAEWWQKRIDSATTTQDFDLISDALCNDRTLTTEQFQALDNELSNQRWGAIEAEEEKAWAAARTTVTATVRKQDLEDVLHAATELLVKYTKQITDGTLSAEEQIATIHIRNELHWAKQRVTAAAFGK